MPSARDVPAADLPWYRALVVAAILATVAITWPLWEVRLEPPMLPAADLPRISLGLPLTMACLLTLIWPRVGAVIVTAVVAFGMAADQTRMQPEFFSLPLLIWGSLPSAGGRLIARSHLIALWSYAGVYKLLSPEYMASLGPRLLVHLPLHPPPMLIPVAAGSVAFLELATAALALVPAIRRAAACLVLVLHAGVLVVLWFAESRNWAVWPWNIVLALSGFALIAPWRTPYWEDFAIAAPGPKIATLALIIAPLGFYLGVMDAYPAHQLYSSGTARATVYCPAGCQPDQDLNATWFALSVPLPPQPRLFRGTFAATCAPGDVIRIVDPHPPPWGSRRESDLVACPVGTLPASHP